MDLEKRIEELKALNWQGIKAAAEAIGLEKSDGVAWADFAEQIALAEAAKVEPAPASQSPEDLTAACVISSSQCPSSSVEIKGTYPTEFYKNLGFPVCGTCGAPYQHDATGNPVCPESLASCPRLTA